MKRILTTVMVALGMLTLSTTAAAALDGVVPPRSHVCMMQDTLLKTPGIPIQHAGKTYFGCCPMCNEKIASEPNRYTVARDPVSGKAVDKATAELFSLGTAVFFFESPDTRDRFAKDPGRYLTKNSRALNPPVTTGKTQ